jgi:hypothetical protein
MLYHVRPSGHEEQVSLASRRREGTHLRGVLLVADPPRIEPDFLPPVEPVADDHCVTVTHDLRLELTKI